MDITIITFIHIFFINTAFIVVDYFILMKLSKTDVSFFPILLGGIISLFLGVFITTQTIDHFYHNQWFGFSNGIVKKSLFLIGAVILILCNVLIELPFYIFATKNKNLLVSLKSAVISNFITNIPVGLLYLAGNMYYAHTE